MSDKHGDTIRMTPQKKHEIENTPNCKILKYKETPATCSRDDLWSQVRIITMLEKIDRLRSKATKKLNRENRKVKRPLKFIRQYIFNNMGDKKSRDELKEFRLIYPTSWKIMSDPETSQTDRDLLADLVGAAEDAVRRGEI